MSLFGEILLQTLRNIWAHKLRSLLTMFGISWGIASIVFMIAIGEGFKLGYRNMLYSLGTDIVIFWSGRTTKQAGGQRAGKNIRFQYDDVRDAWNYYLEHDNKGRGFVLTAARSITLHYRTCASSCRPGRRPRNSCAPRIPRSPK